MVVLALDAMGGDKAPNMIVDAIEIAHNKHPHIHFKVYGNSELLSPLLAAKPISVREALTLVPTTEVIGPEVKPSLAVRGFRQSSLYQAVRAVADGEAEGVVSAGNTGAYMALAMMAFRTVAHIARPAIATLIPNMKSASVMLDLGANVSCDEENLVQFAVMGSVFASLALNISSPSIGLLNIGSEDLKGHLVVKEAAKILNQASHLNFYGFVEGDDIAAGTVDVIVTDGFTGNVALKTAEGIVRMLASFAREAFTSSLVAKLGYLFARRPLQQLKNRLDPRHHDGALFIGLNRVAVKSHGGTDAVGFANAIGVALNVVEKKLNTRIVEEINKLSLTSYKDEREKEGQPTRESQRNAG